MYSYVTYCLIQFAWLHSKLYLWKKKCILSIKYWPPPPKKKLLDSCGSYFHKYTTDFKTFVLIVYIYIMWQSLVDIEQINGSGNIDRTHNKLSTDRYLQSRATYIETETYNSIATTYVIYIIAIKTAIYIGPHFWLSIL